MSTNSYQRSHTVDLTLSDGDASHPAFKTPRNSSHATPDDATPRRPLTSRKEQQNGLQESPKITATEQRNTALATPPDSQSFTTIVSHGQKRRRTPSLSPSLARIARKHGKFDETERRAASPASEGHSCLEKAPDHVDIDEDSSSTTSTSPSPVIDRDGVQSHNGHVLYDPAIFSPKPFHWDKWTSKDYAALSSVLEGTFDASGFARQLSNQSGHRTVTTEEVHWVLHAVVTRPLRLAADSRRRGEEGMQELKEYVEKHGTEIRWWSTGRTKIRGEFLGLQEYGVVIALATTRYGKAEQDAANRIHEELVVEKGSGRGNLSLKRLSTQDVEYLRGILSAKDLKVFKRWVREIKEGRRNAPQPHGGDDVEPDQVATC